LFVAYNAMCYKCVSNDTDVTNTTEMHCVPLEDRCVIDGRCYAAREPNPNGTCEQCEPGTSQDKWSRSDSTKCSDQKARTVVYIVIIVLSIAVVLAILAFTIYIYRRPNNMDVSRDLPTLTKLPMSASSAYDTAGPASFYSDEYTILGSSTGRDD
jgi:hypothetical protein